MVEPRLGIGGRDSDQRVECLEGLTMLSLLRERNAKADEMLGLGILLVGAGDPFDGVVILSSLQAQQTHQLQAVDVTRVCRKRLLAAELCVEMAAGLHVQDTKLMEGRRRLAVVTFGGLFGPSDRWLAVAKVHIGVLLLLTKSADS